MATNPPKLSRQKPSPRRWTRRWSRRTKVQPKATPSLRVISRALGVAAEASKETDATTHKELTKVTIRGKDGTGALQTFCVGTGDQIYAVVSAPVTYGADVENKGKGGGEIHVLSAAGKPITHWTTAFTPQRIAADPQGNIYVGGSGRMAKYDKDGKLLMEVTSPHVEAVLKDKETLREQATEQLKEQKEQYKQQVEQFTETLKGFEDQLKEFSAAEKAEKKDGAKPEDKPAEKKEAKKPVRRVVILDDDEQQQGPPRSKSWKTRFASTSRSSKATSRWSLSSTRSRSTTSSTKSPSGCRKSMPSRFPPTMFTSPPPSPRVTALGCGGRTWNSRMPSRSSLAFPAAAGRWTCRLAVMSCGWPKTRVIPSSTTARRGRSSAPSARASENPAAPASAAAAIR